MRDRDEGFTAYVEADWDALVRFARLVCTGDPALAEDVVQRALVKLYPHWRRVESTGSPHGYVRRSIAHEYHSIARRHGFRRERVHDDPQEASGRPATASADLAERVVDRDLLLRALAALSPPPAKRAAVVMRYVEDRSDEEIGRLLGYQAGSVKNLITKAKNEMRTYLEGLA